MLHACMGSRGAYISAVQYKTVVDVFPVFAGNKCFKIFGDLGEVALLRQVKPECESLHVRVGRYAFPDIK